MGYVLVTPPTDEPLTLAEVKQATRTDADITYDDAFLTALIAAVRQYAEQETGRSLLTQQWCKVLDRFPGSAIELEKGPVQRIDDLAYVDMAGVVQTITWSVPAAHIQRSSDGSLIADLTGGVARIQPGFGKGWPIAMPEMGAVRVTFTAGYGNAGAVPEGLKNWMKLRIGSLNAHREDLVAGNYQLQPLPYVDSLLNAYTIRRV